MALRLSSRPPLFSRMQKECRAWIDSSMPGTQISFCSLSSMFLCNPAIKKMGRCIQGVGCHFQLLIAPSKGARFGVETRLNTTLERSNIFSHSSSTCMPSHRIYCILSSYTYDTFPPKVQQKVGRSFQTSPF